MGHRGLVGTTPPRTLLFHATNAADKELALKANGYWHYKAANLLRANASIEGQIWGGGARPNVVVHAGEAAAAALATATYDEHLEEVALPMLLAAILSGRLPVLPALPCAETRWLRRPLPDPPQPPDADDFVAGSCRASPACAIRHVAAGATGAKERARDDARAAAFGYARHSAAAPTPSESGARRCTVCPSRATSPRVTAIRSTTRGARRATARPSSSDRQSGRRIVGCSRRRRAS